MPAAENIHQPSPTQKSQRETELELEVDGLRQQLQKMAESKTNLQNDGRELLNLTTHHVRTSLVNIRGFGKELEHACHSIKESLVQEESLVHLKVRLLNLIQSDINESLHYIQRGVDQCENFLQALTILSRIHSHAVNITPLNPRELVHGVLRYLHVEFQKRDIICVVEEMPVCNADRTLLSTALRAILENAARFYDPRKSGMVKISAQIQDNTFKIIVQDNGIGILPEQLNKVFEMMYRGSEQPAGGLGIGLTVALRSMEIMGGTASLQSQTDRGTTVCLQLPI